MKPHYYLMKSKKILRLEGDMEFESLSAEIRERAFDEFDVVTMNQEQANWRVVLFRDEILEYSEYLEWMASPEAFLQEEDEDLIAI